MNTPDDNAQPTVRLLPDLAAELKRTECPVCGRINGCHTPDCHYPMDVFFYDGQEVRR